MRILIAEDDPTAARFLRRALEKIGHEVTVTLDGAEAWDAWLVARPQVLISDWIMPRLDGLELCRTIREESDNAYTYILLLSSKDSREDRLEGLRAGADDFLIKPFDPDELAVRLGIAARILAVHEALARQNEKLIELASLDDLTGLKNRRRFREDLELHFALASRRGHPLSLILLDVDHFKGYNDTFGHQAGDVVLRTVADLLAESTRRPDVVARYGGEEFAILLPSTLGPDAMGVAERVR
ncbi:diguanylate cyclase, partial [Singulisphaera rosea]